MAAFVDLKERMNMTFLTLDYCGKEEIYGGKNFATGTVACDVLNIPEETVQQIVLLTNPMMRFVDALYDNRVDLLLMEQSRKNVFLVISLLKTVAPFSYQDFTWLDQKLSDIFSAEAMRKASRQMHKAGGLGELFVRALSLVAQLGFGIQEYQRALIPLVESLDNEDLTRNAEGYAKQFTQFFVPEEYGEDTGQITTFNQLGFKGVIDKPDGWYLPDDKGIPAIILETKSEAEDISLQKWAKELIKNCNIALTQYKHVVGILYNGKTVRIFLDNIEAESTAPTLQDKSYYLTLFTKNAIDKQQIYTLTKRINDCLHFDFGIKNLYHRMIFTACALVGKRYGALLVKGMAFTLMKNSILSTLSKSLEESRKQNLKLDLLIEVYSEIKMNNTTNQDAIDNFIEWIAEISDCVNSDFWNGEDVMGIFFNEFNRYKKKSDSGQVFTPDHITSFMYRLIDVDKDDRVLDAACGSGAFLVKAMCNMVKEAGGVKTKKAATIKDVQLYGIEFDREIFALACANMLIHKDGKTNLEQLDSRTQEACDWIKSKNITKVLMNPPFESKYGCLVIVDNVLRSVAKGTKCAFILPDKKLEKDRKGKKLLEHSTLHKIIKLPEKVFSEGVTTSIFIFEAGVPQNKREIFACYIEDDGLETVKNQGRQDIKDRWQSIEDTWVEIIRKQSGNDTIQWLKPAEALSYQIPKKDYDLYDEDFVKTMMHYLMFQNGIDVKSFADSVTNKVLFDSVISKEEDTVSITVKGVGESDG